MESAGGTGARELHLLPRGSGWLLAAAGSERPLGTFEELGRALDVATAGSQRVRVVVHGREPGQAGA